MDSGNPNSERQSPVSTLSLRLEHDTFKLDINGEAPGITVFLAMLDMATREFEARHRQQLAMQMQAQLAEQAKAEQIRRMVSTGRS